MNHLRLNAYHCSACKRSIITRDRDVGVTPMLIDCRATPGCTGLAQSAFYRGVPESASPTHEFYRPSKPELAELNPDAYEHCQRGGLLLREIGKAGAQ